MARSVGCVAWVLHMVLVSWLFQKWAPNPYMDEPFHIAQTQHYCRGRFDVWDPKITTFPGLYLVGVVYAHALRTGSHLLSMLTSQPASLAQTCSTASLRFVNVLGGQAALVLMFLLHRRLHPASDTSQSMFMAAALALFPLHWFFQFLFYTDVISLLAVLTSHLQCLERRYWLAAVGAAAATVMRQTNAVWAAFTLGVAVLQECQLDSVRTGSTILGDLTTLLHTAVRDKARVAGRVAPLALVPAAFALFVRANGGIVVGDRAAHAPVLHLVQLLYFALFSAVALAPVLLTRRRLSAATDHLARHQVAWLVGVPAAAAVAVAVVDRYTVAHPYLLADNRHYTFYLWKDGLGRSLLVRRAVVPAYLAAGAALLWAAQEGQPPLWVAGWAACTAAVLVPAALVEFRYFTTPFVLLALHLRPPSVRKLAVVILAWAAVDGATAYLFLARPFTWPDGSVARFIW